jgi:hypothetical protein
VEWRTRLTLVPRIALLLTALQLTMKQPVANHEEVAMLCKMEMAKCTAIRLQVAQTDLLRIPPLANVQTLLAPQQLALRPSVATRPLGREHSIKRHRDVRVVRLTIKRKLLCNSPSQEFHSLWLPTQ